MQSGQTRKPQFSHQEKTAEIETDVISKPFCTKEMMKHGPHGQLFDMGRSKSVKTCVDDSTKGFEGIWRADGEAFDRRAPKEREVKGPEIDV